MKTISPESLKNLLSYDPTSGDLVWLARETDDPQKTADIKRWNSSFSGKKICSKHYDGYLLVSIHNRQYKAHRVAWAIANGSWPNGHIDHIDGNRANNSLENLRVVTPSENAKNRKRPKHNTSGYCGVHKTYGKFWGASIMKDGRRTSLGQFKCVTSAAISRLIAERAMGFHKNHGRA